MIALAALVILAVAAVTGFVVVKQGLGSGADNSEQAVRENVPAEDSAALQPAAFQSVPLPGESASGSGVIGAIGPVAAVRITPRPPTSAAAVSTNDKRLAGRVICIDPGHAVNTNSGSEPIGPGSSETKTTEPGGTSGVISGVPEYVVTLAIAKQLKVLLEAEGAKVVMVREGDYFEGLARDRTLIANQAGADLYVRIHCDGSTNQSANGASTLYPASIPGWTDDIVVESTRAARSIQAALVNGLGVPDLGAVERSDMLGFNWSDVPAILAEVGFMTNPDEDRRLTSPEYQLRVAQALDAGIADYFSAS